MNEIFGVKHLILLIASVVIIVLGCYFSRKNNFKNNCKIFFLVGVVSEIIKIFYYIIQNEEKYGGYLPKTDLPFHLCSIQIIFISIICFSNNEKLKRFIISFMVPSCLFGGIAALLIATQSSLNGMWIITAQYFLYHIMIIVFSVSILMSKEIKLEFKDYVNCLKFLVILMFFSIYINSMLNDGSNKINFMYVVSPPQEGLPFLNEDKGWFVYIIRYLSVILLCVTVTYIKPIILLIRKKIDKNQISKDVI